MAPGYSSTTSPDGRSRSDTPLCIPVPPLDQFRQGQPEIEIVFQGDELRYRIGAVAQGEEAKLLDELPTRLRGCLGGAKDGCPGQIGSLVEAHPWLASIRRQQFVKVSAGDVHSGRLDRLRPNQAVSNSERFGLNIRDEQVREERLQVSWIQICPIRYLGAAFGTPPAMKRANHVRPHLCITGIERHSHGRATRVATRPPNLASP